MEINRQTLFEIKKNIIFLQEHQKLIKYYKKET